MIVLVTGILVRCSMGRSKMEIRYFFAVILLFSIVSWSADLFGFELNAKCEKIESASMEQSFFNLWKSSGEKDTFECLALRGTDRYLVSPLEKSELWCTYTKYKIYKVSGNNEQKHWSYYDEMQDIPSTMYRKMYYLLDDLEENCPSVLSGVYTETVDISTSVAKRIILDLSEKKYNNKKYYKLDFFGRPASKSMEAWLNISKSKGMVDKPYFFRPKISEGIALEVFVLSGDLKWVLTIIYENNTLIVSDVSQVS